MPKKGLLAGPKVTKSHSTIIPEAAKIILFLKNLSDVDKIVPSEIVPLKPAPKHLKISNIQAGLKLAVRGNNARQIIYVYTTDPADITEKLQLFWQKTL